MVDPIDDSNWADSKWADLKGLARIVGKPQRLLPFSPWNASELLAERVRLDPSGLALAYLDRRYSWQELDLAVARTARAYQALGIGREDVLSLLMDNRPEFVVAVLAASRLRAIAALINTSIAGAGLTHALRIAGTKKILVGAEHADKLVAALADLESLSAEDVFVQADPEATAKPAAAADFASFDALLASQAEGPSEARERPRGDDKMCFIYTSGTTGLPKAAIIKNTRYHMASRMFGTGIFELTPRDTIYVTLPLYHSNGMFAGLGASLVSGAAMALRRKFSASNFWDDVRRYDATVFVYIGELLRYLLNQPEHPEERNHRLRVIAGNGLRPDIWREFQQRFRIPLIREFYGATEGNAPIINYAGRPGMIGRLGLGQKALRCDPETGEVVRNAEGRCEQAQVGETALLVAVINRVFSFDGYADREATQKKILEDVFKPGDRFFNTGDLLDLHEDGWVSFADRVGDTFRWKGENVSTNEVAEVLNGAPGVLESNVYGVRIPGTDGRAGMASLNCSDAFAIAELARFVRENLPVYQRPYFVRLQKDMRITGTFKHQKVDYRREGYDPGLVSDPLYFLEGENYVPLDATIYAGIQAGSIAPR